MKTELAHQITEKYPDMFYEERRGKRKPTMHNNIIYCGDGWFNILMKLCEELHAMRPKVMQIKEKFGGLRFYASFPKDYSEQGWGEIRKAEAQAIETCEQCGEPGELRIHNGWRYVNCQPCHEAHCEEHPKEEYP